MAQVILKNIKKVYEGKVVAVDDFNLKIEDKEFVVLVGPSGCGKSTTLRMVAGLEEITDGWLYIDDRCVNDVAPKDRDIAMVFQNYALYPHLTVYENMAFALKIRKIPQKLIQKRKVMKDGVEVEEVVEKIVYRKMPPREIKEKVMAAAELLGITELLERKPKALSGGQRQRVAIGRAIVREPKVFLMDEPLSNLDAKLRNQMRAEIIKLHERINTTFIYVTHDQTEAMTLGDRIVIMKDGFVQQIGTPKQVFQHPSNIFVAGFIGTPQMNLFDAELVKGGGKYAVKMKKAAIALPDHVQAVLTENDQQPGPIKLGIRPEHIILTNRNDPAGVRSVVDVSEMMGSEFYLHVNTQGDEEAETEATIDKEGARVSSDTIIRIAIVDLPIDKKEGFSVNDEVNFTFDGGLAHLFDAETGENLIYKYVPEEVEDPVELFGFQEEENANPTEA